MKISSFAAYLLIGFGMHTGGAVAAASDWKLATVTRFGTQQGQVGTDSNIVKICLYRDKATAGFFSLGKWKASFGDVPSEVCEDRINADLTKQILYLSIPDFLRQGGYLAGRADAYCPSNRVFTRYSACTSSFFVPSGEGGNYRNFSSNAVVSIGEEAGLFVTLEKMRTDNLAESARKEREEYLRTFENATTLNAIELFEKRYQGQDPDGLIKTLAPKKEALQRGQQLDQYASAKSAKDFAAFIATYDTNDLEGLIPTARIKLAESSQREAIQSDALKKQVELDEMERQIRYCVNMTARAKDAIERENKIGQVSGYVNKKILREAGETIVMCRENNPRIYAEYRKKGGTKSLPAIGGVQ